MQLTRYSSYVEVEIDANGVPGGTHELTLESFDTNSYVKSTLKRDVIKIDIFSPPSIDQSELEKEVIVGEDASWTLEINEGTQQITEVRVNLPSGLGTYLEFDESKREFSYEGKEDIAQFAGKFNLVTIALVVDTAEGEREYVYQMFVTVTDLREAEEDEEVGVETPIDEAPAGDESTTDEATTGEDAETAASVSSAETPSCDQEQEEAEEGEAGADEAEDKCTQAEDSGSQSGQVADSDDQESQEIVVPSKQDYADIGQYYANLLILREEQKQKLEKLKAEAIKNGTPLPAEVELEATKNSILRIKFTK